MYVVVCSRQIVAWHKQNATECCPSFFPKERKKGQRIAQLLIQSALIDRLGHIVLHKKNPFLPLKIIQIFHLHKKAGSVLLQKCPQDFKKVSFNWY